MLLGAAAAELLVVLAIIYLSVLVTQFLNIPV